MTADPAAELDETVDTPPSPATHRGPRGDVRARPWSGHPDSIRGFLDGDGTVAFWFDTPLLMIDPEQGPLQIARPGDWVVWAGGVASVVRCADFIANYRQL